MATFFVGKERAYEQKSVKVIWILALRQRLTVSTSGASSNNPESVHFHDVHQKLGPRHLSLHDSGNAA